jgi:hypothetical protein
MTTEGFARYLRPPRPPQPDSRLARTPGGVNCGLGGRRSRSTLEGTCTPVPSGASRASATFARRASCISGSTPPSAMRRPRSPRSQRRAPRRGRSDGALPVSAGRRTGEDGDPVHATRLHLAEAEAAERARLGRRPGRDRPRRPAASPSSGGRLDVPASATRSSASARFVGRKPVQPLLRSRSSPASSDGAAAGGHADPRHVAWNGRGTGADTRRVRGRDRRRVSSAVVRRHGDDRPGS